MLRNIFLLVIILVTYIKSITPCSEIFACPDFYTCCYGVRGWGCCPGVGAICCADGFSCCPPYTICDLSTRICRRKMSEIKFLENSDKIEEVKETNPIIDSRLNTENLKIFFEGLLSGLNLYKEIPDLKNCSIIDQNFLIDIGILMKKIYDFDEKNIKSSFIEISISVKQAFKDFKKITKGCQDTSEEFFKLMEKIYDYVLDNSYVEKVSDYAQKNIEEIKKVFKKIHQEKDSFERGKLIGEFIIMVLFPEYKS